MSYSDVKQEVQDTFNSTLLLQQVVQAVDTQGEMTNNLLAINTALTAIYDWANANLESELLNSFLADLKTLFTNYSATLSIIQGTPAYGENYGEAADKLKFVISKDGVSAEKVFDKDSINQEDI